MLRPVAALALLALFLPHLAFAGPWPRSEGESFLSFSSLITAPMDNPGAVQDSFTSIYFERGLSADLTFGLDAGISQTGAFSAIVFAKKPVLARLDPHRFALRLGLGVAGDGGTVDDVSALVGGYWGRGFETRFGPGWAVLDLQTHYAFGSGDVTLKADATLGIKPSDRWKLMMQVQAGDYPGAEPFLRLAPSVAWSFGEGRHIELGAQIGLVGDDRVGVKLGTWLEF